MRRHYDKMETSSYLFTSKRKKRIKYTRKMEKRVSSESSLSDDSLEDGRRRKLGEKKEESVDTILVPFYENDVLIKVPKSQKKVQHVSRNERPKNKIDLPQNYLVNKTKNKRTSYLEIFRRQFSPDRKEKRFEECEISSTLPEYGDTERESIDEDSHSQCQKDFYNTESYNEMYYDKILQQEGGFFSDNSLDDAIAIEGIKSKHSDEDTDNNLKSVSEVTPVRRHSRTATVQPIPNVKLMGLGPDLEKIRPRLERARSLQRYSEKVRMENRLKIYKKTLADEEVAKAEKKENVEKIKRVTSARLSAKSNVKDSPHNASYLVNKVEEKKDYNPRKIYENKAKSALSLKNKIEGKEKQRGEVDSNKKNETNPNKERVRSGKNKDVVNLDDNDLEIKGRWMRFQGKNETKGKTETKNDSTEKKGKNMAAKSTKKGMPPVQINFLVNVGGLKPSSMLRSLEEKHRKYQEQVKAFMGDNNNT